METAEQAKKLLKQANDLAFAKFRSKEYEFAEVILNQALKVDPYNSQSLQLLGLVKHGQKEYKEAIDFFEKAVSLDPENLENYNNIGLCYSNLGEYEKSIEYICKAIEIDPCLSYLHSNLALQYMHQKKHKDAIKYLEKALKFKKEETTYTMIGACYGEMKDLDKAEEFFLKALEINPNFSDAHVDLATVYKMKGDWEKAWKHFEYRKDVYNQLQIWNALYPKEEMWDKGDLKEKRILVYGEQGSGDQIHFFRYIKYLRDRGAYIILHCDTCLKRLFEDCVDEVFVCNPYEIIEKNEFEKIPKHDFSCSILSLPHLLEVKEIPNEPYIKTKSKRDISEYSDKIKIGIVWAGNPQHPNDIYRSCYLSSFRNIHNFNNVKLFSLVKDIRPRKYANCTEVIDLTINSDDMKIVDMSPFLEDFYSTAEIIESLDLIISVDSAVLHLAGAMGKKSYGLLSWNNDWRWKSEGKESIWYPTTKLFRQEKLGEWGHVFNLLEKEIKNEFNIR